MANSSLATRNPFDTRASSAAPGEDPLLELARLVGADDPFADLFRAAGVQRTGDPSELRGSAEVELEDYPHDDYDARDEHELGVYADASDLRGRDDLGRAEPSWNAPRQARAVEPADDFDDDDWAAAAPRDLDEDAAPASGLAALRGGAEAPFPLAARHAAPQRQPAKSYDDFEDDGEDAAAYADAANPAAFEDAEQRTGFRAGGAMIAAAVVGLAVLGGGGSYAFWQMSGSAESDGPPPVIKAEATPTKVVPSNPGGADIPHQNKLVYDRVGGSGQPTQERLAAKPQDPIASVPAATQTAGSTGVAVEPRRVRTVVVKPDGTLINGTAEAPPAALAMAPTAQSSSVADQTAALPSASASSAAAALPSAQRAPAAKPLPPVAEIKPRVAPVTTQAAPTQLAAAPSGPAMSSLASVPSATAVQPAAAASRSTASLGTAATGGEAWSVQLASQRTEDQARAAYQGLQQKYSSVLAGQQPQLQKAELADKGTYYRVRLAMGSRDSAVQLCANLKAAGGDCLVQKN